MSETTLVQRPDVDIEEAVLKFIRTYDPLKQARGHFDYTAVNGHVTLRGNVRSVQAHRVLVDNVPDIEGVLSVDASQFFDDETIRIQLGKVLPPGVLVRVNYGTVVVTLKTGTDAAPILEAAKQIPGVRADKVVAEFI